MPFAPAFSKFVGILPLQNAALEIIADNFLDALGWRRALDASTGTTNYARRQKTVQHSDPKFPALFVQIATESSELLGTGGITYERIFEVQIWLSQAISGGSITDGVNALSDELIRYYDATCMAWLSAPDSEWAQFFPAGSAGKIGNLIIRCTDAVFGQTQQGEAAEVAGQYARSVSFELVIKVTEVEG